MRLPYRIVATTLAILLLSACSTIENEESDAALKSQLDQPKVCTVPSGAFSVLYIGNSLTKHGFDEGTIKTLGWDHVSGMAASSPDKDFVSLLDKKIETVVGRPVVPCYHNFGGSGKIAERLSAMGQVEHLTPDLVVIQLGEHEVPSAGMNKIREDYRALLKASKAFPNTPPVIAVGAWCPSDCAKQKKKKKRKLWVVEMDESMAKIAKEEGVAFSSTFDIAARQDASGTGATEGVRWHPNDVGHALYADRLYQLYMSTRAINK